MADRKARPGTLFPLFGGAPRVWNNIMVDYYTAEAWSFESSPLLIDGVVGKLCPSSVIRASQEPAGGQSVSQRSVSRSVVIDRSVGVGRENVAESCSRSEARRGESSGVEQHG
jgi:hypothetical protein